MVRSALLALVLIASFPAFSVEKLAYKGNFTWESDYFTITQHPKINREGLFNIDYFDWETFTDGFFTITEKVESIDSEYTLIRLDDDSQNRNKNESYYWTLLMQGPRSIFADTYIEKSSPLVVYYYVRDKNYNLNLTTSHLYDLEFNSSYYDDIEKFHENINKDGNIVTGIKLSIIILSSILFIILSLQFIFMLLKKLYGKFKCHQNKNKNVFMAKIAEEEAIRELVRNHINKSDRSDLDAIRKKIADAIESENEEKLEHLLKIAERMKNI